MKVEFKGAKIIEKKRYEAGVHELPKEIAGHWYVKAMLKSGDAKRVDLPPVEVQRKANKSPIDPDKKRAFDAAKARVEAQAKARQTASKDAATKGAE